MITIKTFHTFSSGLDFLICLIILILLNFIRIRLIRLNQNLILKRGRFFLVIPGEFIALERMVLCFILCTNWNTIYMIARLLLL